jgi:hypothetical protein
LIDKGDKARSRILLGQGLADIWGIALAVKRLRALLAARHVTTIKWSSWRRELFALWRRRKKVLQR